MPPTSFLRTGMRSFLMTATVTAPEATRHSGVVNDVPALEVPGWTPRGTYSARYKRGVLAEYERADRGVRDALFSRPFGAIPSQYEAAPRPFKEDQRSSAKRRVDTALRVIKVESNISGLVEYARGRQQQEPQRAMTDPAITDLKLLVGGLGRVCGSRALSRDALPVAPHEPVPSARCPGAEIAAAGAFGAGAGRGSLGALTRAVQGPRASCGGRDPARRASPCHRKARP